MRYLAKLYRAGLGLFTDLYQVTMAYGYWKNGLQDREAVFHLHFRSNPFGGGYAVACGLATAMEWLEDLAFTDEDRHYLAALNGVDGSPLLEPAFLEWLGGMRFACDVDAVPEGTLVFPYEPLLRVQGPIIQCQLVETALLCIVNFQTLIATKAARVCTAARGEPVIEFGARRAQGIDGAVAATRAAYVGGCAATSNLLAGRLLGIPVRGTHAHSWVMLFDDEREAFLAYARALPNNCVFLVDTYDTLEGVRHAIEAGRWLREHGHEMIGIRLDSGDLAALSVQARRMLDEAGFPKAVILASNELDETILASLKEQGAAITVWGVGTRLVTAHGQSALGGVYKLSAVRRPSGTWQPRIKISEQTVKTTNPGVLQVRRFWDDGTPIADAIYDVETDLSAGCTLVDPLDPTRRRRMPARTKHQDLLVPVFRAGRPVYEPPPLEETRRHAAANLAAFPAAVRRFVNPHLYPVGLEESLHQLKTRMILEARESAR